MSYYTLVTFEFSEEPPEAQTVAGVARQWLDAQEGYATDDILEHFERGWTEGQTEFPGLVSFDMDGLMCAVSAQFPTIRFYVRGMGEEFEDVWLRQFEGGQIIYRNGPFGEFDVPNPVRERT